MSDEEWCRCGEHSTPISQCPVMREFRLLKTPEGKALLAAEYLKLLQSRQEARGKGNESWSHAGRVGCPQDALLFLRSHKPEGKALDAAVRFCGEARKYMTFLVLLGDTGVGKTTAAAYVVLDFCKSWAWNDQPTGTTFEPVMVVDAPAFTRMSVFDSAEKQHLERMKDTRLLVLEDAGDEGTELGKGALVELLMHRHATKRRTVLCSNLVGDPFVKRYGDAVADRLRTSGIIPNLQGVKSYRRPTRGDT